MKDAASVRRDDFHLPVLCRCLVDASPMPVAGVEGKDHTICYVNTAFCAVTGKTAETLIGSAFTDCVAVGDGCLSLLERVYQTGKAEIHTGLDDSVPDSAYWSYVMWPVHKEVGGCIGVMIQITETVAVHQSAVALNQALLIGSVRQHELTDAAETLNAQLQAEIVQRKHAEQEKESRQRDLEASEARYRGLIEAIPQIVWTATPGGELDFANSKWFEAFGTTLEYFNEAGWPVLVSPKDKQESLQAWAKGLESRSTFEMEHRLGGAGTGRFRRYLSRAVPISSGDGEILKWFGTTTDVEDQKQTETALFNKQKLDSLGVLAGGIAHDFNNLLCVVLGGASLMADALPPEDSLQGSLTDIINATERAAHLTRQMLAYAGKGQFLIEQLDMGELVQSTCDLVRASLPKNVVLTVHPERDLPAVSGDAGQMQQVVMNLVMNAGEAIDQTTGGRVRVKITRVDVTAARVQKIELITGNLTAGRYIVIEIQDSGCGMDEETREKIFDPFFTTKFTGRGLGLSAVQGIIRGQKGALGLESVVGTGSVFCVYIPAAAAVNGPAKDPVKARRGGGTGTVLVVDDEDMVRRTMQLSLESGGYTVQPAASGEEALMLLQSKPKEPISLVLLDLSMPGMSGKQVMQRMLALGIAIPVMVCSGYSEDQVQQELSGLQIAGFVKKPFTGRQLTNIVAGVLKLEQQPH